ncbi:putative peptidoglycan lipid II flippase [Krasilnikovia cinnamomea]|uniref:Putative peptidoglycan lipid II flippase n=1 Tax=Krasilnikovia cinnamomea TaxID=349313 RepID=A0A4Q7ZDV8_9ACTN|nr:lipid II flippase MurJ [Krasilnikovia cinnamomea]RZU48882.1 putative peptidoglycan lipid II flippase [Krasilnikovia cinnamomea]
MSVPPEAGVPERAMGPGPAEVPAQPGPETTDADDGRSGWARPAAMGRIAGAAAVITLLTVVARLAGFGRTFVFLHTVGHDSLANVYNAANTIPNIVFEIVAGGALASLVVPLLAGAVADGDRARVTAVASALLTWVLTLLVPLALVVALAAGPIAGLLDIPAADQVVAARMLRVFAPQLPLYGIGIVLTGVLQAHHRFAWPVIAPLLSSVTVMTAYLTYAALDGAGTDLHGLSPAGELTLSIGTTLGVVVLTLCLLVPLRRLRLRLRPRYRFPGAEGRQAVRLGWAGAVTVGAQQIMVVTVLVLAVHGPLTLYNAAQTMFLLPWAVLAVPLATAVYPGLATAAARGDETGYADALARTARSVTLLACLGAAALAALAEPAASLLNADGAAPGMVGFAPGLLGYALFALLSRALYARGATTAAALATAAGWGVAAVSAVALANALPGRGQVFGLGLANTIGMTVLGLLLVLAVRRRAGAAALAGLPRAAGVGIVAAVAAGLLAWAVVLVTGHALGAAPDAVRGLTQGILGGVVLAAGFVAVAYPLDRHDVRPLVATLARRLRRRGAGTPNGRNTS